MRAVPPVAAAAVVLSGGLAAVSSANVTGTSRDCGVGAIRAFSKEHRISHAERTALIALLAQLRAHPPRATCVSGAIRVTTKGPAPGTTDVTCLQAMGAVGALQSMPGHLLRAQTRAAARRAYAVLRAHEARDGRVCVVPR